MANDDRKKSDNAARKPGLAGGEYGATEREQTEDIERARRPQADEAGEFVTDAEMEVREANGEEGGRRR